MKVAVIGTGKTGGEVTKLLGETDIVGPFNSSNKPTSEILRRADVAVIFVPGSAVSDVLDVVMQAGIPAVWGSTGNTWPKDLDRKLKAENLSWIKASNFSLGMNIVRHCIKTISRGSEILKNPVFRIHEIHHVHKKDAPSGTALSWKGWLGKEADVTSERKGDIKGIHELHMKTSSESICLKHEAHDRSVFARGALWAAEKIVNGSVPPGMHDIESVFDRLVGI